MRGALVSLCTVLCCAAMTAQALDLTLPATARQTASRDSVLDQVSIPIGPYQNGAFERQTAEGPVTRRAYRIPASGATPLQLLQPLRAQVEAAGYDILLDCNQDTCGGFDFRFAIDVLPAPNMYVNIRDYHFISAHNTNTGAAVTLLGSAAAGAGYLQIIQVGDIGQGVTPTTPTSAPDTAPAPPAVQDGDLETALLGTGSAVLRTLEFALGTTSLNDSSGAELSALANLLATRPGLRIAVVGHTDTVGDLDTNISVSRARARAVRRALIDVHGADGARIEAEGMGYLSPVASNLTEQGREANRRVEVIVVADDNP